MLKFDELRKCKNGMPTFSALIPVVLHFALQKPMWNSRELRRTVADAIDMPPDLRHIIFEKTNDMPSIEWRAGWAISYMRMAGLMEYPKRSFCAATALGKELYDKHGAALDEKMLKKQPKFIEHLRQLEERKKRKGSIIAPDTIDISENVEETIHNSVQNYNQIVATELLEKIIASEPIFFEHLVKDLLVAMGYKGEHGDARVTAAARDGGIDGIINQDALGTSTVYFQAKRYNHQNTVQRQDIEAFYGALSLIRANRAIFITTSRFSKSAEDAAKSFSIVLIDGIMLTDLMLQYKVGVRIKKEYKLYDIDPDLFSE